MYMFILHRLIVSIFILLLYRDIISIILMKIYRILSRYEIIKVIKLNGNIMILTRGTIKIFKIIEIKFI